MHWVGTTTGGWCLFLVVDVFLVHFRSPSNDSEGNVFLSWVAKSNGLRGRLVLQGFCLYIHKVWRSSLLTCRPFDGHYQSQQRSLTTVTLHWSALVCLHPAATISQRSCNPWMGLSRKGGRYQNWDWSCEDRIRYACTNKSWLVFKQWYQFLSILNKSLLVLAKWHTKIK